MSEETRDAIGKLILQRFDNHYNKVSDIFFDENFSVQDLIWTVDKTIELEREKRDSFWKSKIEKVLNRVRTNKGFLKRYNGDNVKSAGLNKIEQIEYELKELSQNQEENHAS